MGWNQIQLPVKMDSLGRVTIPKILRDVVGLSKGDTVLVTINDRGKVEIAKLSETENQN